MSNLMSPFSPFSAHKRKRSSSDVNKDISEPDWKRRTVSLPLRSPARRPQTIATSNPTFNTFTGALTPDYSEDESLNNENDENRLPSLTDSQSSNDSSSSVNAHVDQDSEMTLSAPTRPRLGGRARSNDILSSPRRRPHFVIPDTPHAASDRIPTPITANFDHQLAELPNAPRHSFPPLRTNLSPMVEQENWSSMGPDGLPSPSDDYVPQIHDPDAMMLYDQTSDSMSGLRVDDAMDAEQMLPREQRMEYGLGLDGHSSQGHRTVQGHSRQTSQAGRTARLHMGYLLGCDKCAQKVPGHYSHILWS